MAIVTEQFEVNGVSFTRTYSNSHRCVVRDGESYSEATDPTALGRTYEEGEFMEDATEEEKAQEILNILMGEEE